VATQSAGDTTHSDFRSQLANQLPYVVVSIFSYIQEVSGLILDPGSDFFVPFLSIPRNTQDDENL
jgi:hypothetical protein